MSDLSSAIHSNGHYHVRPRPVCLWSSCARLGPSFQTEKLVARPKRFELLTPRFVVWCSIQLSYGRFCAKRGPASAVAADGAELKVGAAVGKGFAPVPRPR